MRLLRASGRVLGDLPERGGEEAAAFVEGFSDDHGHRRPVDRPFLCGVLGLEPPPVAPDAPCDVRLWRLAAASEPGEPPALPDAGPLSAQRTGEPIEVWTESDLSALHALWRLARRTGRATLTERAFACARWHVAETQPDNATNHPWAIHVFAAMGVLEGDAAATHYAEGLLHACQLTLGRPDRMSAMILLDAGEELRRLGDPSR